ncbi:acetolactate synthase I/II/III large subunit [Microbispora rosea subsp. aerata]|nr:thiamine pyrophosphate-binding protein [Microbispora rosea]GGO01964.1 acetolactate synthase I/II/III large subunit [Microbispora rosea subsp. aerata]GIH54729.1 acetolactate synthase I/II/III large subunit [Microbispora rosea subsp. aerata]GLJ86335.1 acetolactate synthase I/II/III large subunit [Microbispora rosea subsp. aerata]
MNVAEAVGAALAALGVRAAFGVVGSGNFHLTNALIEHGVRFVAARHEGGAATMADAYARMSGTVAVLTVHQGPGLTNALTGVTEAAKSRTPLLVLAPEATSPTSNFRIDQTALAEAVGAHCARIGSAATVVDDTVMAFLAALLGRRTVVLNLPLDVQAQTLPDEAVDAVRELVAGRGHRDVAVRVPAPWGLTFPVESGDGEEPEGLAAEPSDELTRFARMLAQARRPVFVAGRGARGSRRELEALGERVGALFATSAVAKGHFHGSPWDLDVSGGFATPLAAELIRGADLVVGWGCSFTMWTTRHGALIGPDAKVVQVDLDPDALGVHREIDLGVVGDVRETARAVTALLGEPEAGGETGTRGYRSPEIAERIAREGRWRDVPYEDLSTGERIDPRTLTIGLDDLLPQERLIAVDSGNFMGYPSMFLTVPDGGAFCFTQAFQAVGLGLATAIGAAMARPDRLTVAALGDGGALMGVAELETVVRLGLPMVVVVYDDDGYGAEVHHFGPHGFPLGTVTFPPADIAAIARGFGFEAVTVRREEDLSGVAAWLKGPRDKPLLVHAKVANDRPSWWLEEAFRGH